MRNNCYFISGAETSSTAEGMRGGWGSSQSAFCFKLQGCVQGGHRSRVLWWCCRCCPAELCGVNLLAETLALMLPGEPNILLQEWHLNKLSARYTLSDKFLQLLGSRYNRRDTHRHLRAHTCTTLQSQLQRSLGIRLFANLQSKKWATNDRRRDGWAHPAKILFHTTTIPTHSPPV